MSQLERFYLQGAIAIAVFYLAFAWTITGGGVLVPLRASTFVILLLAYAGGLSATLGMLWVRTMRSDGSGKSRADEREEAIEARADRAGYYTLDAGLFLVLLLVILKSGPAQDTGGWSLEKPETLALALVSLSAFAGCARFVVGFIAARRG